MGKPPGTADERERRFVAYLRNCSRQELGELRLARLNKIANFRKALLELIEEMIEARAEDLAAAMLLAEPGKKLATRAIAAREKKPRAAWRPVGLERYALTSSTKR